MIRVKEIEKTTEEIVKIDGEEKEMIENKEILEINDYKLEDGDNTIKVHEDIEERNELNEIEGSEAEERTESAEEPEVVAFDLMQVEASKSKGLKKVCGEPGAMTVVRSEKNGNRITVAGFVMKELKKPTKMQIGFTKDSVVVSEDIPGNENYFNVSFSGDKGIIYAKQLVLEIIERFNLDFDGITSKTFGEVKFYTGGDYPVAVIKIKE